MARLNYSAEIDELEQAAGSCETKANVCFDAGETVKAAFFYGAAAGIDQLLLKGKPEDAHFRVNSAWSQIEGRFTDGE